MQMDNMLNYSIDGWKCDGTDPFIIELIEPQAFTGPIDHRFHRQHCCCCSILTAPMCAVSTQIFTTETSSTTPAGLRIIPVQRWLIGRNVSVLGDDRLIMSRPVDAEGPWYMKFSPKYTMISGWVGDQGCCIVDA